jgi:O-antigen/teichoic acid export membrane protein
MVLALPILTRLYQPEDFSLLAVYASTLGIVAAVACLRYNIAIPIPQDDADGIALLAVSLLSALAVSAVIAVPVLMVPQSISAVLGQPRLEPYLWMLPVGIFFAASYDVLQYWASRMKRFSLITYTRMTRALGGTGTQLGIGYTSTSPFGLICGHMVYSGLGIVGLLTDLVRNDRRLLRTLTTRRIFEQAKKNYRFPVYSVPEALLNTAAVELPIIIIAAFAVGPEAGFLMLAIRVMGMPMMLIGNSVGQVYLVEARTKQNEGTLTEFTRSTMWSLFRTGAPLLIAAGVIAPLVFPIIFGSEWERAGTLVAWMVPWFILQFVASPVSMILHILGQQHVATLLQATGLLIRVGTVLVASSYCPAHVSEVYALSSALFYAAYVFILIRIVATKP